MRMEQGVSPMVTAGERAQAVASYARAFFGSMGADEFALMIENARSSGQLWLVERLYSRKVIDGVVGEDPRQGRQGTLCWRSTE